MKRHSYFDVNEALCFLHPRSVLTSIFILAVFSSLLSCESKGKLKTGTNNKLTQNFRTIDSLCSTKEFAPAIIILDSIQPVIQQDDILNLSDYYFYRGKANSNNINLMNLYGDSLMRLYEDTKNRASYPNGYLKALTFKADLYIKLKQYDNALTYLFKIKPFLSADIDRLVYTTYLSKIAHIYYSQKKYRIAASYNKQAYDVLSNAVNLSQPTIFFQRQGFLNNAGFSYENAGLLDSAEALYIEGISYLEKEAAKKVISENQINSSKIVFLDNLGGLNAKRGKFLIAEKLLEQSVSINDSGDEAGKTTVYLKLADTYGKLGKTKKADSIFDIAEKLIYADTTDRFYHKSRFQKVKGDWLFSIKRYKEAYEHLNTYNHLTDSLNQVNPKNSQVDLTLKFENLQTKEDVASLAKTNENKTAYLIALGLFLIMLAPIIVLILKNTRQSRRAEKATLKHNIVLENAMKRLELRNKDYAKMMKVMAHDLKNPIGGMVGVANLLLEDNRFAKEDKELLHLIESSGENAIEMITQLLNSGLAIENEELKKEKIDLQHLLRQCTELLQYKADEKKQKIIFVSGGPVIILLSKEKIWRVFNNLIVNAIKFSPENTEIKVVLERLAKSVKISIIDHGIGVIQKDKQKIFEMFTSAKRPGTAGEQPFGIGLSISKQIIESHDGKIWLDENPLGGTIFYVELPTL